MFPLYLALAALILNPYVLHALAAYPNPLPFKGALSQLPGGSPTLCKHSGTYYMFTSGVGLKIYTSTDLATWKAGGVVWPNGTPWAAPYTGGDNENLWAPDCKIVDGEFRLFYSASTPGSQKSAIFYAHSKTGASGSFTNGGLVVSSSPSTTNFNAIDPNLSLEPVLYLSFGSYWDGIRGVRLSPTTFLPLSKNFDTLAYRDNGKEPYGLPHAEEAPVIAKLGDFWYLFTSWNRDNEYYEVHVARSDRHNGGYFGKAGLPATKNGGTVILSMHDKIRGPGGQDVFTDTDGKVYLVYHYKLAGVTGKVVGLNRLDMSSGWPVVV
ncbi:glycosyl hydrolase [Favolaschia claudopus]|uniref:Endo-1,5-alpha-L-arabinanase A n=1 Tax=Favolaschia claudopus TaxID=2862362 RepID=A0AAW0CYT9_9AGAR